MPTVSDSERRGSKRSGGGGSGGRAVLTFTGAPTAITCRHAVAQFIERVGLPIAKVLLKQDIAELEAEHKAERDADKALTNGVADAPST
jgi:hypothetical protein